MYICDVNAAERFIFSTFRASYMLNNVYVLEPLANRMAALQESPPDYLILNVPT